MEALKQLSERAAKGHDLTTAEAAEAAQQLADEAIDGSLKGEFLKALARKGESAEEVAAFARTFRELAVDPGVGAWADRAIDVCGTGGDGSGTFNISTAVSFLVAASGISVFKHGNRSITSKCGSADLLESLGFDLQLPREALHRSLEELNFCFFFAPAYHPAFKAIMPVRRQLAAEGQRSIFNLLGPLINPGRPAYQLMGVFSPVWVGPLGRALGELGLSSGLVVHGQPAADVALDELSCAGTNLCAGFGRLEDQKGELNPVDYGLPQCRFEELKGGDTVKNKAILLDLFEGRAGAVPDGLRNTVLLNAGAAIWAAGLERDLKTAIERAEDTLEGGAAKRWLERARSFHRELEQ